MLERWWGLQADDELSDVADTSGDMKYGTSDVVRPEHVWILVAVETAREALLTVDPATSAFLRRRIVALLSEELQALLTHYRTCIGTERTELKHAASEALLEAGFQIVTTDDGQGTRPTQAAVFTRLHGLQLCMNQPDVLFW